MSKILGRLAYKNELEAMGSRYQPIYNNQANIKVLSELPENLSDKKLFVCYLDKLDTNLLGYDSNTQINQLMDKFIVFDPNVGDYKDTCWNPEYIEVENEDLKKCNQFVSVPSFNLDKLGLSFDEFESKLTNFQSINVQASVSNLPIDLPRLFIAYKKKEKGFGNNFYIYSGINKLNFISQGKMAIGIDVNTARKEVFHIVEDGDKIIDYPKGSILFMPIDLEEKYINILNQSTNIITLNTAPDTEVPSTDTVVIKPTTSETTPILTVENPKTDTPEEPEHNVETEGNSRNFNQGYDNNISTSISDNGGNCLEMNTVEKLQQAAKASGLLYTDKDLVNFEISIKSSTLVVLSGMSGTGKSRLVKLYAKASGISEYGGLKFIAVNPSWTDDSDILGYVDHKNMLYRAADIGLVDFLIKAEKNPDKKFIVCFDEMNLARVEHYFSQFISVLENDPEERTLVIYNKELEGKLYNSSLYPAEIKLGENLYFIGTVNVDESTFNFSDKVLDRANVIKLNMKPFKEMKDVDPNFDMQEKELDFLDALNNTIRDSNPKLGIGYRILNQFNKYLKLVPDNNMLTRSEAFDKLVVQRVITKLRGSEEQVADLVGRIDDDKNLVDSKIVALLEEYTELSKFDETKNALKKKAKELMSYGYTI